MWTFMHWFYSQMDLVYVNSEHYRRCWIDRGIPAEKLKIFPRGLDTTLFHPDKRATATRAPFGAPDGEPVLLYVGRISREKDLDVLARAFRETARPTPLRPPRPRRRWPVPQGTAGVSARRHLHRLLAGADLARAFASADIFVFPSTTDTFGNVVLERWPPACRRLSRIPAARASSSARARQATSHGAWTRMTSPRRSAACSPIPPCGTRCKPGSPGGGRPGLVGGLHPLLGLLGIAPRFCATALCDNAI